MTVGPLSAHQPVTPTAAPSDSEIAFDHAVNSTPKPGETPTVGPEAEAFPPSFEARLKAVITKAAAKLPPEAGRQLLQLVRPKALAAMAVILGAWGAGHLFGAGEAADVLMVGLGWAGLGGVGLQAGSEFGHFASQLAHARTNADLDGAADHLARGISIVGVQGALAWVFKSMRSTAGAVADAGKVEAVGSARLPPDEAPFRSLPEAPVAAASTQGPPTAVSVRVVGPDGEELRVNAPAGRPAGRAPQAPRTSAPSGGRLATVEKPAAAAAADPPGEALPSPVLSDGEKPSGGDHSKEPAKGDAPERLLAKSGGAGQPPEEPPSPSARPAPEEPDDRDLKISLLLKGGFTDAQIKASPRILDSSPDRLRQVMHMLEKLKDGSFIRSNVKGSLERLLKQPQIVIDNAELALNKGFADNGTKLDALIRIFSFLDGTIPPRDEIDAALKVFSDQPGFDGFTQLLSVVNAIDPPQSTVLPQIRFDAVMKTLELRNLHLPPPPNPWPSLDELIARADAGVRILREAGFTDAEIEASPRVLDFPSDRLHQVARMVGTLEDAGFVLWDRRGAAFVWLLRQPQGVLDAAEEAMRSGVPPFPTVEAWESPRNWDQFRALMVALIAKFGGIVG